MENDNQISSVIDSICNMKQMWHSTNHCDKPASVNRWNSQTHFKLHTQRISNCTITLNAQKCRMSLTILGTRRVNNFSSWKSEENTAPGLTRNFSQIGFPHARKTKQWNRVNVVIYIPCIYTVRQLKLFSASSLSFANKVVIIVYLYI